MEINIEVSTAWGKSLVELFAKRVASVEDMETQLKADKAELVEQYERSVDDRVALRILVRDLDYCRNAGKCCNCLHYRGEDRPCAMDFPKRLDKLGIYPNHYQGLEAWLA